MDNGHLVIRSFHELSAVVAKLRLDVDYYQKMGRNDPSIESVVQKGMIILDRLIVQLESIDWKTHRFIK